MTPQDKALADVYRLILEMLPGPEKIETAAVTAGSSETENPVEEIQSHGQYSTDGGSHE